MLTVEDARVIMEGVVLMLSMEFVWMEEVEEVWNPKMWWKWIDILTNKIAIYLSISMKLSTIDIILFFWVSDTFGGYVILLSSFVFYNARKCGISSFSLYSLDKDQIRQRSLNVTKNSGNFNICLKLTLTVVWVLLDTLGSF